MLTKPRRERSRPPLVTPLAVVLAAGVAVALAVLVIATGCPRRSQPLSPTDVARVPRGADPMATGRKAVIVVKGSDTLLQVARGWAAKYMSQHPDVVVEVSGGGSAVGLHALPEGTTDIANASRKINEDELEACRFWGVTPEEHVVGYDGICVIANKENPVQTLSVDELADLYTGKVNSWAGCGGSGEVVLLARDHKSGTFQYFREHVIERKAPNADYAASVVNLASNEEIREKVAQTRQAIGYIGLGYLDDSVKALGITDGQAPKPVLPSLETVRNGTYPISRPLFVYVRADCQPTTRAFVEWLKSSEGQAILREMDFVPLH